MKRLLILFIVAAPLAAQDLPLFPRFSVTAGGYSGQMTTDIRLDPETTGLPTGTTINLERDLGLATKNDIHRFALAWRPFARHQLDASYFSADRHGFRDINQEITFGDVSFPVQAAVSTDMRLRFAEAAYTYWARQTPTNGFGVTLGVSTLSIDAAAAAKRPGELDVSLREAAKTDVPVPAIGLQLRQAFTSRLLAEARGAFLPNAKVQNIRADAKTANVRLEYRALKFLGIGAGYNYFDLHGDVTRDSFAGKLRMKIQGAEGYVRLAF